MDTKNPTPRKIQNASNGVPNKASSQDQAKQAKKEDATMANHGGSGLIGTESMA
jgi:hypothetical protein